LPASGPHGVYAGAEIMTEEPDNLPVQTEQSSLLEYLDSLLPFRIPRLPFVRVAANLDKAAARLILAKAEQRVALIEASTAKTKHRSNVEGRFLETAERIAEQALKRNEIPKDVALSYLEAETQIKFSNRTKVLDETVKQLTFDPPKQDSTATIDDDWLNMFSRIAEDKSSEELQSLFGKILAGEIREPGAINLRTLTIVSTITHIEANIIIDVFKFILARRYVPLAETAAGPEQKRISLLGEMGILTGVGGLFSIDLVVQPHMHRVLLGTQNGIRIDNLTDSEFHIDVGVYPLSEAGEQLFAIAKIDETPLNYLREFAVLIAQGKTSLITLNPAPLAGKAEIALLSVTDGSVSVVETVLQTEPPINPSQDGSTPAVPYPTLTVSSLSRCHRARKSLILR
jgi:hypothetical protein